MFISVIVCSVFDKGYVDCNFLLTGQQVAIVTAGVGVFEVYCMHDIGHVTLSLMSCDLMFRLYRLTMT